MADSIDNMRPWPITRSEWDGLVVRTKRLDRLERWIPLIGSICGAVACYGGMRNAGVDGWALWAVPAVVAMLAALFFGGLWFAMRSRRTPLGEVLERAWEGGGCVCPLCRGALPTPAADGAVPSCPHGLSVRDQPQLVEYWAACARRDDVTAHRIFASLFAGRARPSLRVRLARLYTRNLSVAQDQEQRFFPRYLAALALLGLFGVPALAGLVPVFWSYRGPALSLVIAFTVLQSVFVLPFALMSIPMRRRAHSRCAACSQILASPHPARCPECGLDHARTPLRGRLATRGGLRAIRVARAAWLVAACGWGSSSVLLAVSSFSQAPWPARWIEFALWFGLRASSLAAVVAIADREITNANHAVTIESLIASAEQSSQMVNS
jgi:hypothetical protein